jgi:hypothetical protein
VAAGVVKVPGIDATDANRGAPEFLAPIFCMENRWSGEQSDPGSGRCTAENSVVYIGFQ